MCCVNKDVQIKRDAHAQLIINLVSELNSSQGTFTHEHCNGAIQRCGMINVSKDNRCVLWVTPSLLVWPVWHGNQGEHYITNCHEKHQIPQDSELCLLLGHRDLLMWRYLGPHCDVTQWCALSLDASFTSNNIPLLGQLLPRATEWSQAAMFNVIGSFGRRPSRMEGKWSNLSQNTNPPIYETKCEYWAAAGRGWQSHLITTRLQ